jgi:uncharacterized repeat protein (TIGR03803 family)
MSSLKVCLFAYAACLAAAPIVARANPPVVTGIYSFGGFPDAEYPIGGLTFAAGYLWGTSCYGGTNNTGTLYRINATPGSYQVMHSFAAAPNDGDCPTDDLLLHNNILYGTTENGGAQDNGTIFSYDPGSTAYTLNYQFQNGTDGAFPVGKLRFFANHFWGVTKGGGAGFGTIYRLNAANIEQQLFQFQGTSPHQGLPYVGLTKRGNYFYGTTNKIQPGTIYKIKATAPFNESLVYPFAGGPNDGKLSRTALLKVGTDFYGTTESGGMNGGGIVYKLDNANVETVIYNFQGGTDGSGPSGDIAFSNGRIYGTTVAGGGPNDYGTVFEIDPATHMETGLYAFTGGMDGAYPRSGLRVIGGHMYGTATSGGTGAGTIFQVN